MLLHCSLGKTTFLYHMCELKQEKHGVESEQLQSNVLNSVRIEHIWDWDDLRLRL